MNERQFSVMIKPVGARCNLDCGYCYYNARRKGPGAAPGLMPEGVLAEFTRQYIKASPGPNVYFTWHGGEPTLAGLDFFKTAVSLQKKYARAGKRCVNNLQTNGTLLDDEWRGFLAKERFDVGLSLDGAQNTHDHFRLSADGKKTYNMAIGAARRLIESGVNTDLLCTVNAVTVKSPLQTYSALKDVGTGWIQFIPVVNRDGAGRLTDESVTAEAYGDFLCAVFGEWIAHDLGKTVVQLFAETARAIGGGAAGLCWTAPECGAALIVEADGSVYSCDHFADEPHKLGNVMSDDLRELADSPKQRGFGARKRDGLPAECRRCRWLALCNGGCPKDRFAYAQDGEPGLNILCAGLKQFFARAEQPLALAAKLTREGRKADEIMGSIYSESRKNIAGAGRNDPCPCGSGRKAKNCCLKDV